MDKIKSFIREAFSLERIAICLAVFVVFILVPIYIISLIATAINMGFAKLILNVGFIGFAFVVIFAFGVILSLIYTTYSRIHNKGRYKDEYFYEDIDYKDEDTDE